MNIELVNICKQLGHEIGISQDNQTHQFHRRIGLTSVAFGKLQHILGSNLPILLKRKVFNQYVIRFSRMNLTLLY